ncbi:CD1375 family protein [Bacillus sp. SCS-151]
MLMWIDTYYKLIKEGRRTIDQVPEHLRADVQTKLDADHNAD